MIRQGQLCRSCSNQKCNEVNERQVIELECTECGGQGCEDCISGYFELKGCPNEFCRSVVRATNLVDLFYKGLPPVGGGVLDQSQSFIEVARILDHETSEIRARQHDN